MNSTPRPCPASWDLPCDSGTVIYGPWSMAPSSISIIKQFVLVFLTVDACHWFIQDPTPRAFYHDGLNPGINPFPAWVNTPKMNPFSLELFTSGDNKIKFITLGWVTKAEGQGCFQSSIFLGIKLLPSFQPAVQSINSNSIFLVFFFSYLPCCIILWV